MAKRILGKKEIEDIIWGAAVFGGGEGGSPHDGMGFLSRIKNDVTLLDTADLPQNESAVMVAGIGSPTDKSISSFGPEATNAYEAMKKIAFIGGIELKYLMSGEVGGLNSVTPFYIAAQTNTPVIDADGNGRACPSLGTTLYGNYKIPTKPLVIANRANDVLISYLSDPFDAHKAEMVARTAVSSWGTMGAFCTWIATIEQVRKCLIPGAVTKCEKVGQAIREARTSGKDAIKAIISITGGKEVIRGRVTKMEQKTVSAHDFGRTVVEGAGQHKGKSVNIDSINENLIAWQNDKPIIMVPDIITLITVAGEPLTNADVKEGMDVSVLAIPAPEPWTRNKEGISCWQPILDRINYKGSYVRAF